MKKITPINEWQKAVIDHIKLLKEDEKREFAHKLIFDMALEVGDNGYEILGILEAVKFNLMEYMNKIEEDKCKDCDDKDCPDNPDNKK